MDKIIEVDELEQRLEAVLNVVVAEREPRVLARHGKPEAALISYEDYVRFQMLVQKDSELNERWERAQERIAEATAHLSDEELEADIATAIAEVRAERRAREQAAAR